MAHLVFSFITLIAAISLFGSQTSAAVTSLPTSVTRWPSIVQVEIKHSQGFWAHSCAGVILRASFVLSSAQCFSGCCYQAENRRIRAGASFSNSGGIVHCVESAYNHPSYGSKMMDGDISVVRLRSPLTFTNVIQQGRFITQGTRVPDDLPVWSVGWSYNLAESAFYHQIKGTEIQTVNNDVCAEHYASVTDDPLNEPVAITDNMICAGVTNEENVFCPGDPGSPLYYLDPSQGDIIVGLFSFSKGCTNSTLPAVTTAVSSYTAWFVATAV